MRLLTAFILFCIVTSVQAQDYVVTLRNDTLRGRVAIHSYSKLERVLVTVDKKKNDLAATAVKLIWMDSAVYVPVRTNEGYLFMHLARPGFVSLCYSRQSPGTPYDVPFLVKRTGESIEVTALRFRKSVSNFLSECASIQSRIEEDQLGRKDLDKIIDEYNACLASQTHEAFVTSEDPKLSAINALQQKLSKDASAPTDAMDILKDLYLKVKDGKLVPNYLLDGLKETLKDFPSYDQDIASLSAVLKK